MSRKAEELQVLAESIMRQINNKRVVSNAFREDWKFLRQVEKMITLIDEVMRERYEDRQCDKTSNKNK